MASDDTVYLGEQLGYNSEMPISLMYVEAERFGLTVIASSKGTGDPHLEMDAALQEALLDVG